MGVEILFWNFCRRTIFSLVSLTIIIIFDEFWFKNGYLFDEIKSLSIELEMFLGFFLGQRCHCEESWKWFYTKYKWGKKLLNRGEKTSIVKCHYWGRPIMKSKLWLYFCPYMPYRRREGRSQKFFTPPQIKSFLPPKCLWRIVKVWGFLWMFTSDGEEIVVMSFDIISKI